MWVRIVVILGGVSGRGLSRVLFGVLETFYLDLGGS